MGIVNENDYLEIIKQQAIYQSASIIAALWYKENKDIDTDKAISIAKEIVDKVYV